MEPLAEYAGWSFGWLLRNSAHAAVLAAVVWSLERTVLRRLSPRWRYGLWLLVVARLVLPIAPASAFSLFNLVDLAPAAVARLSLQLLGLPAPLPVPITEPPHPLADTPPWFLVALALWLPGAVILAVLLWRDHRRLRHALRHTTPVTDTYILDVLQQSKAVMRVRRTVALVESEHVSSPAIYGFTRPWILLPAGLLERLTTDEIRFLFLHELAHVKRADIGLNWVLAAVQILHWFNPAVWFALRRLISVREEVCDECVLRSCFAGAAREYGLTLLHLLEECAPRRMLPATAGILDDVRTLRRRMRCIRAFGQVESRPWLPAGVTVALAIAGLTENKNHNTLILSATVPTPAELLSARPSLRPKGQGNPHPGRTRTVPRIPPTPANPSPSPAASAPFASTTATATTSAAGKTSQGPPTAPSASTQGYRAGDTLRSFSRAFRQVIQQAFGPSLRTSPGGPTAVASETLPTAQIPNPPGRRSLNGSSFPTGSGGSAANGAGAQANPAAMPIRLAAAPTTAPRVATAASSATAPTPGRLYPLPPVGQRGDILRPLRVAATATDVQTPLTGTRPQTQGALPRGQATAPAAGTTTRANP
jgi:bla regulator protein BlaR1